MESPPEAESRYRNYLLSTGHAPETTRVYISIARLFGSWCAAHEIEPRAAERESVQAYLAHCLDRVGRNTVALRLAALRTFFAFCGRPQVTEGLRVGLEKLAPRQPFSAHELAQLFAACRNERDRAMITLALPCGLRVSELVGMRQQDVELDRGLLLVHGKGSKQRWVALDETCCSMLQQFPTSRRGLVWLTRDAQPLSRRRAERNMEEIAKRAGLHAHWHRLRTTFATRFLNETHDLESLQTLMGHASPDVTARYAAYTRQQRALDQMRRLDA